MTSEAADHLQELPEARLEGGGEVFRLGDLGPGLPALSCHGSLEEAREPAEGARGAEEMWAPSALDGERHQLVPGRLGDRVKTERVQAHVVGEHAYVTR